MRRAQLLSCGAAAYFSQGRKPLGHHDEWSKAPEGRHSGHVTAIRGKAYSGRRCRLSLYVAPPGLATFWRAFQGLAPLAKPFRPCRGWAAPKSAAEPVRTDRKQRFRTSAVVPKHVSTYCRLSLLAL